MAQSPIRLLGLTLEQVADFRTRESAKNAGFYAALDRQFPVVGIVRPTLSRVETIYNRLTHLHPNWARWRSRNQVNFWAHQRRTAHAERRLTDWSGKYDLIVQLHTIFAPGQDLRRRRYVLHTDNTYMLSERYFGGWTTMGRRERDAWVRVEGEVYRNAAFLFPRTEFLRRSLIDDYGCDPERAIVVGYGASFLAPTLENRRYDTQTALFVGIDFVRKGGPLLLKAWEQVRRRLPNARLQIVGPPRPQGELPAGVEWLGHVADRARIIELYRQASAFVLPSLFEPSSNALLEAMGQGTACVTTSHGANPEIVEHKNSGLLVEAGQVVSLADALVTLLADPACAEAMGRAAYARVRERFTWDAVATRMAPFIKSAVA